MHRGHCACCGRERRGAATTADIRASVSALSEARPTRSYDIGSAAVAPPGQSSIDNGDVLGMDGMEAEEFGGTHGPAARRAAATAAHWCAVKHGRHADRSRRFHSKSELRGHTGAVYTLEFSPCGRILASGSFDKTVRFWDALMQRQARRPSATRGPCMWLTECAACRRRCAVQIACLTGHTLNVSDVAWSRDSGSLLSGSYDATVRLWNVEAAKCECTGEVEGFVQTVALAPFGNEQSLLAGTSHGLVALLDRRNVTAPAMRLQNDSMINSLYAHRDGTLLLTGDASGTLKTWDLRMGERIDAFLNDDGRHAIAHIHVLTRKHGALGRRSRGRRTVMLRRSNAAAPLITHRDRRGRVADDDGVDDDDEERYLAVNSYDNGEHTHRARPSSRHGRRTGVAWAAVREPALTPRPCVRQFFASTTAVCSRQRRLYA